MATQVRRDNGSLCQTFIQRQFMRGRAHWTGAGQSTSSGSRVCPIRCFWHLPSAKTDFHPTQIPRQSTLISLSYLPLTWLDFWRCAHSLNLKVLSRSIEVFSAPCLRASAAGSLCSSGTSRRSGHNVTHSSAAKDHYKCSMHGTTFHGKRSPARFQASRDSPRLQCEVELDQASAC